jgi:pimeloyl-ACP methyl ester carboxylesterase
MEPPPTRVPEPDTTLEPAGYMVDGGEARIHFLDWDGPRAADADGPGQPPGFVAIHGLAQTGWIWAPVARRLGGPRGIGRFVAMDLRGHGLSDAPTDEGAYDLDVLAGDVVAVAEGSGALAGTHSRVVLGGHGFGAIVAAHAAWRLGPRCSRLVLVDGGWESIEDATGLDVEEFLRGLDEPPEVMRSLAAYLRDREGFDPTTWDADQEQAARATVVETHAGRVVPSARPHAIEACVRTMFSYDPLDTLPLVEAEVVALVAVDDDAGSRVRALRLASEARQRAGLPPIVADVGGQVGHNLMRYRPDEVAAAFVGSLARRE